LFDEWNQPFNRWTSDVYHRRFVFYDTLDVPMFTTDAADNVNRSYIILVTSFGNLGSVRAESRLRQGSVSG
jgi:hypothetical protein